MTTETPAIPGVFTRKSSGLVRSVSGTDALYYGIMAVTIAYIVFMVAAWPEYPGSSMEWATFITTLGAIALGTVYALLAATYPRSGGEYVFLSRLFHPALGFVISFLNTFWYTFYFGVNGAFFAIYGLSPLFTMLGLQTHNSGLVTFGSNLAGPWGIFLAGSAMVLTVAAVQYRGMRAYFLFQRWGGTIALISVGITILVFILAQTGVLDFQKNFDALAGAGAYNKVLAGARSAGTPTGWSTQLGPTFNFAIWPAFSLFFAVNMISFSGEIRNVRQSQFPAIVGSMVVSGILMIALTFFGRMSVGTHFLLAASANAAKFPLPVQPYLNLLASVAANNVVMTIVVNLWVILMILYAAGTTILYPSRALFAWSIDGIAPRHLATVSERYHTPVVSIVVLAIAAEIALALFAFTTTVTILSGLLGFAIGFLVVSLAGLILPFFKRDLFEGTPAGQKLGNIPLISLAGIVASPFVAFLLYRTLVDTAYGANTPITIRTTFVVIAIAIVWFFAARWYQKSRGVNVDRRFQEIPVE